LDLVGPLPRARDRTSVRVHVGGPTQQKCHLALEAESVNCSVTSTTPRQMIEKYLRKEVREQGTSIAVNQVVVFRRVVEQRLEERSVKAERKFDVISAY
jgi:predicted phage-related endonuclease